MILPSDGERRPDAVTAVLFLLGQKKKEPFIAKVLASQNKQQSIEK